MPHKNTDLKEKRRWLSRAPETQHGPKRSPAMLSNSDSGAYREVAQGEGNKGTGEILGNLAEAVQVPRKVLCCAVSPLRLLAISQHKWMDVS